MSKEDFLKHRRNQEQEFFDKVDSNNPLSSILTIELNTTELCNRTCVFCPRHDSEVYPNRNLHMSVEDAEVIAKNLSNFKFLFIRLPQFINKILYFTKKWIHLYYFYWNMSI